MSVRPQLSFTPLIHFGYLCILHTRIYFCYCFILWFFQKILFQFELSVCSCLNRWTFGLLMFDLTIAIILIPEYLYLEERFCWLFPLGKSVNHRSYSGTFSILVIPSNRHSVAAAVASSTLLRPMPAIYFHTNTHFSYLSCWLSYPRFTRTWIFISPTVIFL